MADKDSSAQDEKRHTATERKRKKARTEGRVARAPDVIKLALVGAMVLILLVPGSILVRFPLEWVTADLANLATLSIAGALEAAAACLAGLAALILVITFVGAAGGLVPGGWNVSAKALVPDFSRLNPVTGIKNLFSPRRLVETLKAVLKFLVIGGAGVAAFLHWQQPIYALLRTAQPDWAFGLHALVWIMVVCALAAAVLVMLDVPLQAWMYGRDLRMTDKELRDEQKETEVSPWVRRKLRQAQARIARARMMDKLPQASVVAVNPSHYAVALRYRRATDVAPVVIATGAGRLAERICQAARRHGIPIVAAPPLARALYYHSIPGECVPAALYRACAEILAYVWRLELWMAGQGAEPEAPSETDLDVDRRLDPQSRYWEQAEKNR